MDTKTSFIPKKPFAKSAVSHRGRVDILSVGTIIIAFIVLGAYIGLSFYNASIVSSTNEKKEKIITINKQLNFDVIKEASLLKKQIDAVGVFLEKHIALSLVMSLLEENTIKSAVITKFLYSRSEADTNKGVVEISVEVNSFAQAVAFYDIFKDLYEVESVVLSDIALSQERVVSFNLEIVLNSSSFLYSVLAKKTTTEEEENATDEEHAEDFLLNNLNETS